MTLLSTCGLTKADALAPIRFFRLTRTYETIVAITPALQTLFL